MTFFWSIENPCGIDDSFRNSSLLVQQDSFILLVPSGYHNGIHNVCMLTVLVCPSQGCGCATAIKLENAQLLDLCIHQLSLKAINLFAYRQKDASTQHKDP